MKIQQTQQSSVLASLVMAFQGGCGKGCRGCAFLADVDQLLEICSLLKSRLPLALPLEDVSWKLRLLEGAVLETLGDSCPAVVDHTCQIGDLCPEFV